MRITRAHFTVFFLFSGTDDDDDTRIAEDLEEQSRVRDVMLAHYVAVVEVFKHYASIGSALATGELDLMEVGEGRHRNKAMN